MNKKGLINFSFQLIFCIENNNKTLLLPSNQLTLVELSFQLSSHFVCFLNQFFKKFKYKECDKSVVLKIKLLFLQLKFVCLYMNGNLEAGHGYNSLK